MKPRFLAAALAALVPLAAAAVVVNPDGLGQALIYPYYTVQSAGGDTFNTFVSIVNHSADGKALRLRLRESRNGASAGQLNLYLAPFDTWTAAVMPDATYGARLVSIDRSCTSASLTAPDQGVSLPLFVLTGNSDGDGADAARTREGFVEAIEMAAIKDSALVSAVSRGTNGAPPDCRAVQAALASTATASAAPSGGLSGTLTLINVASGINFTAPAEALADLASRPFFRDAIDPYAAFDAAEIDPVSIVTADGTTWRSVWPRSIDAVTAALMRYQPSAEFVRDAATASRTEFAFTFPTRSYYSGLAASGASYPFPIASAGGWSPDCTGTSPTGRRQDANRGVLDREALGIAAAPTVPYTGLFNEAPGPTNVLCGAVVVTDIGPQQTTGPTALLGSTTRGMSGTFYTSWEHGWVSLAPWSIDSGFTSLPSSTRIDHATGLVTTGAHVFYGWPMVGLAVRSFSNGTLSCSAGSCMGNYGGGYPLQYKRLIKPAP